MFSFDNHLGAWFKIVSIKWIKRFIGSRSDTWSINTSSGINCIGNTCQIYVRWKWNESFVPIFSRRICRFSKSVSRYVSQFFLKSNLTLTQHYKKILIFLYNCSHSLLDQKINNVLSISNDQAILKAIQSIIQNMLATEDPSQQQLHFLQSCGFGGLWRFAGPFTKASVSL